MSLAAFQLPGWPARGRLSLPGHPFLEMSRLQEGGRRGARRRALGTPMRVMTQSLPSGEATFLTQHSVTPPPRVQLLHLPTRKRVITGRENERSRVRGLGQPDASVALDAAKKSAMRTLRPASPGPADAPRPRPRLWPGVAGSERGLCPAPQAAAGSPRFGPSDPFTTRVTRNVLVGSARE